MSQEIICPVPKEQIPIEEFLELSNSWFFSWPLKNNSIFFRNLSLSWLVNIIILIIVSTGSSYLVNHRIELLFTSFTYGLVLPLLIVLRLILGWSYVHKRLVTETIVYEETDWHDGQTWKKSKESQIKDVFVAKYEVMPTIKLLKDSLSLLLIILCLGATCLLFLFN